MLGERSVVPAKVQIPLAVVLAIFFAIVLYARFGPKEKAAPAPVEEAQEATIDYRASLTDLQLLVASLQPLRNQVMAKTLRDRPPIKVDPFAPARPPEDTTDSGTEDPAAPIAVDVIPGPPPVDIALESRFQRLSALQLKAIVVSEGQAIALINNGLFQAGQRISGFIVDKVGEGSVELSDEYGTEYLYLPEASSL